MDSLPVCTAQGGGGSFRIGNIYERLVLVNDGWQSEPTDGSKSGWRQRSVVVAVIVVADSCSVIVVVVAVVERCSVL